MGRRKKILIIALTAFACICAAGARFFFPHLPTVVIGVVCGIGVVVIGRMVLGKQR